MTELIWEGKYDRDGKKTAPIRLALPFQDVETVNESAQSRSNQLDLWSRGEEREWRNRLIWGDKRYVLPSLLPEFAGKVNLIYIDPPFNTGSDFSYIASVSDDPDSNGSQTATFIKEPSMIEQKAYRDTWGRGLDGYLQWFYETVVTLQELLASNGSMYVHLDNNISHYAKPILDEVFGKDNFQNEIIWKRKDSNKAGTKLAVVTDSVFFYSNGDNPIWNQVFVPYSEQRIEKAYSNVDEDGRQFALADLMAPGDRKGTRADYEWNGVRPRPGRHWAYTLEKMQELDQAGRIFWNSNGTPKLKMYLDQSKGSPLGNLWTDIAMIKGGIESVNYPTQKPEALLERIINVSSSEGDLVLDCFCGSGTTAAVAEKLGRRWITCDLGRFAIHTTRKRLLGIDNVRPFVVQNLGKYERQAWQAAEFGGEPQRAAIAQSRYRRFILDLYGAEPLDGYTWIHGVKAGRLIHVGSVDAPILRGDLTAIAQEFWRIAGKGSGATINAVDVLGWDFAFELNEVGKQMLLDANIKPAFKRIPREVLERKAVEQGDIRFFELAALSTEITTAKDCTVSVKLTDFVVHPDDVPQDVQGAITHWSQWIDYWAIDWDFQGDTFHNQWQAYRTKKQPKLQTNVAYQYDAPGTYIIVVKVIDILGNDTTKSVEVEVR